ncbi:MAG: hypothetical protein NVSMB57_01970 [Actinomycetota bacterium]
MEGQRTVVKIVDAALEIGLPWVTLYAFSTENWRRPPSEVRYLLGDTERFVRENRDGFHAKGVRMRWVGRRKRVPASILRQIDESVAMTRGNKRMTLTIAFNYGSRAEMGDAAAALARDVASGSVDPSKVNDKVFSRYLYDPQMPDVDLFIRTSGEQRISNYLLWQAAYAELVFSPALWPDFSREDLFDAIREFQRRTRRFGSV